MENFIVPDYYAAIRMRTREREREGINIGTKREKVRGSFISANWSACPIGSNPVGVIGAN